MERTATAPAANERRQSEELRRSRRRATGLLAAVAVGFVASFALPDTTATGYLRAALEAGLVGGLADWFAVVALFRHPLGIPIPHTAVIPRSKDGLGANLANFVRDNFLASGEVRDRIADPVHVERLGSWLRVPANADRVALQVVRLGAAVAAAVDEDEVVDHVAVAARRRLAALPLARVAGVSLEHAVEERRHDALVAGAIDGVVDALGTHRTSLRRRLAQQAPSWVPGAVNDLVFARAEDVARTFLRQLAADPDHELRRALDDQLQGVARRLQEGGVLAERVDAAGQDLIDEEQLRRAVTGWWRELRSALDAAADPAAQEAGIRTAVAGGLIDAGRRLADGGELHDQVLAVLESIAPTIAETGQAEIEDLITATVDRWDAEDTSRRLELWLGSDLQFVRINGTLVGAAVGIVLHSLSGLLG